ncbi:MAG: creatininase family protein [Tissierellales bacterium]|nr:creatininase family protein [Tissierellales bacterium]
MKKILTSEMSWPEFSEYVKGNDTIIIPVGVLEEHGHHNPLGTDTLIAERAAYEIGKKANIAVAPVLPYGQTSNILDFPGTITLDPFLYKKLLIAYAESYIQHGIKRILFVNGHGGNTDVLQMVSRTLFEKHGTFSFSNQWWEVLPQLNKEWNCADHGGYFETSLMLATNESIVDMTKAKTAPSVRLTEKIFYGHGWRFNNTRINVPSNLYNMQKIGNVGNPPQEANIELGKLMLEVYVDFNVELIMEMKKVRFS